MSITHKKLSDKEYHEEIHNLKLRKLNTNKDSLINNTNFNFSVLTLTINSCLNIGNILRTANLTGVEKFIIFGKRKYEKKSAVLAQKFSKVIRINEDFPDGSDENKNKLLLDHYLKTQLDKSDYIFNENLFLRTMDKFNLIPIFIEQTNDSIKFSEVNWKLIQFSIPIDKSICFVFGNEHYGIPQNILDCRKYFKGSLVIEIEQTGTIASYNVSNSAAIILNSFFTAKLTNIKDKYGFF